MRSSASDRPITSTPTAAAERPNCCALSDSAPASTADTRNSVPTQLVLASHSALERCSPRLT